MQQSWRLILLTGMAGLAIYFLLAIRSDLRHHMMLFFILAGSGWGMYAFVAQRLWNVFWRPSIEKIDNLSSPTRRRQAVLILLFALLYRVILLPTSPWLSDDIFRYVWDGRVMANGINPYQWPPTAPELAGLRDVKIFPFINHPEVGTIYPPLLQLLFLLGQFFGGGLLSLKFLLFLIDAVVLVVLVGGLRLANRDPRQVLLYAWNPLPILEIGGSGHADGLLGLLLLLTVFMLGAGNVRRAALTIGAGFLVKFVSLLMLPYIWLAHRRRILDTAIMVAVVALLGYFPFWSAGSKMFNGLLAYSAKWRFNDGIFSLIYWPIEKLLPASLVKYFMIDPTWQIDAATLSSRRIDLALIITKIIIVGLFLGWMLRLLRSFVRATPSLESWGRLVISLFAGLLLLVPTFQPWYLLWILPLLTIWPNRALLLLSGTVLLSYWTLQSFAATGVWQESAVVKWLEFTPVFAMMVYDYYVGKRRAAAE